MLSTGNIKTNTECKCDKCKNYSPRVKLYTNIGKVLMCHGKCKLNNKYKQRTDTCRKFESKLTQSNEV